jgi:hypothetical protein
MLRRRFTFALSSSVGLSASALQRIARSSNHLVLAQALKSPAHRRLTQETSFRSPRYMTFLQQRWIMALSTIATANDAMFDRILAVNRKGTV